MCFCWYGSCAVIANKLKQGDIFLVYLIAYPTVRFFLEFIRVDYPLIGGIDPNQVLVGVIAVLAAVVLIWRHRPTASESVEVQSKAQLAFVAVEAEEPVEVKKPVRKSSSSAAAEKIIVAFRFHATQKVLYCIIQGKETGTLDIC